jgi:hypothetical protein
VSYFFLSGNETLDRDVQAEPTPAEASRKPWSGFIRQRTRGPIKNWSSSAAVNNAPTLKGIGINLTTIPENTTSTAAAVTNLLTSAGYADPDGKNLAQGVAVIAMTTLFPARPRGLPWAA